MIMDRVFYLIFPLRFKQQYFTVYVADVLIVHVYIFVRYPRKGIRQNRIWFTIILSIFITYFILKIKYPHRSVHIVILCPPYCHQGRLLYFFVYFEILWGDKYITVLLHVLSFVIATHFTFWEFKERLPT